MIDAGLIPNFIKAGSPTTLRFEMIKLSKKKTYHFYQISNYVDERGKNVFIAWYYEKPNLEKEINGITESENR